MTLEPGLLHAAAEENVEVLQGNLLRRTVVEIHDDLADLAYEQLDRGLERAGTHGPQQRLLDDLGQVRAGVECGSGNQEGAEDGREVLLGDDLAEVVHDQLLADALAHVLGLLNNDGVRQRLLGRDLGGHSVPQRNVLGAGAKGVALLAHEGAALLAVLIGPPRIPAPLAVLVFPVVLLAGDLCLLFALRANANEGAEEGRGSTAGTAGWGLRDVLTAATLLGLLRTLLVWGLLAATLLVWRLLAVTLLGLLAALLRGSRCGAGPNRDLVVVAVGGSGTTGVTLALGLLTPARLGSGHSR
eukprot:PhM_4_TR14403/c0_g11_i1/m.399